MTKPLSQYIRQRIKKNARLVQKRAAFGKKLVRKIAAKPRYKVKARALNRPTGLARSSQGTGVVISTVRGKKMQPFKGALAKKIYETVNRPITFAYCTSTRETSSNNQCSYAAIGALASPGDLNLISASIMDNYPAIGANAVGGAMLAGFTGPYQNPVNKVQINSMNAQFDIVSMCNTNINYRVYECVPRDDVPAGTSIASTLSTFGTSNIGAYQNNSFVWGDRITNTTPEGTLYDNANFCSYYKITKVRKGLLNPGQEVQFKFAYNKPKVHNQQKYLLQSYTAYRRLTKVFVLQIWGSPVLDANNSNILIGPSEVGIVYRENYEAVPVHPPRQTAQASTLAAAVGAIKVINDDSGQPETAAILA